MSSCLALRRAMPILPVYPNPSICRESPWPFAACRRAMYCSPGRNACLDDYHADRRVDHRSLSHRTLTRNDDRPFLFDAGDPVQFRQISRAE